MARAKWAEELVADFYRRDGYRIIARNWRCRQGELDIVAFLICDMVPTIVVVEVRARATDYFGSPLESVTHAKQKKLRVATKKFLSSESRVYGTVRFDVASVLGTKIEVVQNAF
ncbi:MAG: YraN family protein [Actinomycetota bacterium]|nr:YraN family protein [Actinomycetota bacterium]